MVDSNIKKIQIPISEINSVKNDGTVLLRYKVKSKDGLRNSHWSKVYKVDPGSGNSFSELNGYSAISVSLSSFNEITYLNPVSVYTNYITSSISRGTDAGANTFTATWSVKNDTTNTRYYDIYLSWYDYTTSLWTPISYTGSTSANTFSFQRPVGNVTYIYVKALITVSSFPKLTADNNANRIALSITDKFSIWISDSGTMNLTSFTIPIQTTTIASSFVTIKTSTPHGFTVGQVTDITGVTPTGYNGLHTITEIVDNYSFKYFDASPPSTSITGAGTIKNRYIATITGLSNSFPIKNVPQEVVTDNTDMGYGGAVYNGKLTVVDKSGTQISVVSSSALNATVGYAITNIRL